jgi:hypothetical protein
MKATIAATARRSCAAFHCSCLRKSGDGVGVVATRMWIDPAMRMRVATALTTCE